MLLRMEIYANDYLVKRALLEFYQKQLAMWRKELEEGNYVIVKIAGVK